MKSRFILSGGVMNDLALLRRMCDLNKKNLNVLSIGFAFASGDFRVQDMLAAQVEKVFSYANPHKNIIGFPAPTNPRRLAKAIREADVIYAHGGNGDALQEVLSQVNNLRELVAKNKIVGGSSAGCNCWSTYYYSNDNQAVMDGLRVLDIKTFCHYNGSKWGKLNRLIKHGESLPVIPLGDEEFVEV